ncbi:hypothetical protein ACFTTN_31730 [Streptomyces niveus]|uniref:hypothetical protein n=1 Tax=Streptomyces niveus TaxID=193462 RepID=UPI00362DB246
MTTTVLRDLWAAPSTPYVAVLILMTGSIWCLVMGQRSRRVRTALTQRVAFEVVPTPTFDPNKDEIDRWARQLGQARQMAGGVPLRGTAIRLHYSVEARIMHCFLEGPSEAASMLAMPGFPEVEVHTRHRSSNLPPVRFAIPPTGEEKSDLAH